MPTIAARWVTFGKQNAKRGVWTSGPCRVGIVTPEALQGCLNSFQLMEGTVEKASHRGKVIFLNFGTDEKTDVTAIIPETAFHRWRGGASDIRVLQGRTLRVRGYVRNSNGPSVWVYDPEQIELIMTPPRPESRRS